MFPSRVLLVRVLLLPTSLSFHSPTRTFFFSYLPTDAQDLVFKVFDEFTGLHGMLKTLFIVYSIVIRSI